MITSKYCWSLINKATSPVNWNLFDATYPLRFETTPSCLFNLSCKVILHRIELHQSLKPKRSCARRIDKRVVMVFYATDPNSSPESESCSMFTILISLNVLNNWCSIGFICYVWIVRKDINKTFSTRNMYLTSQLTHESKRFVLHEWHPTTKFPKSVHLSIKSIVTLKYKKKNII